MGRNLTDYLIGEKGVQLVPSPLHTPDGGLLRGENVEFIRNAGIQGVGTRGGIVSLTAVIGTTIQQLTSVPLAYPGEFDIMLGLNAGETPTWKKSTDGTTYSNLTSATLLRPAGIDKSPSTLGAGAISSGQRCASYKGQFYYPGDDYVVDSTAPPFIVFNGAASFEQFRVPQNPTSTGPARWIADTWISQGIVYIAVYDPSGSAPDHKGRVFMYVPDTGSLTEVGNRFGNGSGENGKGFPFCLTTAFGKLWCGTYGISGNNQGGVYRIQPGVDETWTLDLTATLHNGYYMSLCPYKGVLYAATDADSSGTAIVQARTSAGVWSTSLSAPAAQNNYFMGLIEFNSTLFCCYYKSSSGVVLIKAFDGTSWSTDLDVAGTYAAKAPGTPFIFLNNLYWPFMGGETSASSTSGFLLKRTPAGVWSRVLNGIGVRGCMGQWVPQG